MAKHHFFRLFVGGKTQKLFVSVPITLKESMMLYCFASKIEPIKEAEFFT
jgi:hypothetical protein